MLAAGEGTRLRPLTHLRPKALCPVGNRPLVDWALDRLAPHVSRLAVNVHHGRAQMLAHLADRAAAGLHVSVEEPEALGTAGALGALREWLAGDAVLLTNVDMWHPPGSDPSAILLDGWDGERPRLLCVRGGGRADFDGLLYVGSALLPWWSVRDLEPRPTGLYEVSWRALHEQGRLELAVTDDAPVDCGTPAGYLRANLAASHGCSVVGEGAVVQGRLERSVVWSGARVGPDEVLVDSIRADGLTLRPLAAPGGTGGPTSRQ